jgi:hypothetical protein
LFGKDYPTVRNPDVGQKGCGSIAGIYTLMPSDAMNRVDKNANSNSKGSAKKQRPIRKQRLIATMVQIPHSSTTADAERHFIFDFLWVGQHRSSGTIRRQSMNETSAIGAF